MCGLAVMFGGMVYEGRPAEWTNSEGLNDSIPAIGFSVMTICLLVSEKCRSLLIL